MHIVNTVFYASAFENPFYANNSLNCLGVNSPKSTPKNYQMGYNENRKYARGVFAAPTTKDPPYNVLPGSNPNPSIGSILKHFVKDLFQLAL